MSIKPVFFRQKKRYKVFINKYLGKDPDKEIRQGRGNKKKKEVEAGRVHPQVHHQKALTQVNKAEEGLILAKF